MRGGLGQEDSADSWPERFQTEHLWMKHWVTAFAACTCRSDFGRTVGTATDSTVARVHLCLRPLLQSAFIKWDFGSCVALRSRLWLRWHAALSGDLSHG